MAKFLERFRKKDNDADSVAPLGIGAILAERYRLDAEIGRGGMGIVYRARDISNGRDVAVKAINFERANTLTLDQFQREMDITAQLQHPHIVAVYATVTDTPLPYFVMELLNGTSLDQIHRLTCARIADIGGQVCDALQHIHQHGLVYRDLKPANVILERHGFRYFVKLLDFGLARPRGEAYRPNESSLAGSFFYLAPELIEGQLADVASDLYALGVTLYEMTTGRVPFSNFDEQSVLEQHLQETAAPPSASRRDMPPALEAIILRLLEKSPARRFASASDVRRALEQISPADASAPRGNISATHSAGDAAHTETLRRALESNPLATWLGKDDAPALAAGAHLSSEFSDGVWVVDVEAVDEPLMLLPTAALILGVRRTSDRALTVSLIEYLCEKNILLILKRCDRLLSACAQLAETILRACPEVYILATSSQPLNLPNETRIV